MLWTLVVIIAVLLAGCWMMIRMRQRKKAHNNKVIKLSAARSKSGKGAQQPCSYCKKKASRLSFYAAENGQVIGVCDACKPQADKRDLMRL